MKEYIIRESEDAFFTTTDIEVTTIEKVTKKGWFGIEYFDYKKNYYMFTNITDALEFIKRDTAPFLIETNVQITPLPTEETKGKGVSITLGKKNGLTVNKDKKKDIKNA